MSEAEPYYVTTNWARFIELYAPADKSDSGNKLTNYRRRFDNCAACDAGEHDHLGVEHCLRVVEPEPRDFPCKCDAP